MPLEKGARLGPYEIRAPLDAGGQGEVYEARDTRLGRDVAIKILSSQLGTDEKRRSRFEREARAVAALRHPNVCTLHDVGRENGVDFLVLELLEGETLASRISRGNLSVKEAVTIAIGIAAALREAHRHGLVHRDLKPANVMLTSSGAKLLDFGLAKEIVPDTLLESSESPTEAKPLTEEGTIPGTVAYMAPEQLQGREPDARSDIFALGAVLYEMLTGRRAFSGETPASLVASILKSEPPPLAELVPEAPPLLDETVSGCMAKDPDARWQSAADVALALRWLAEGRRFDAVSPVSPRKGQSWFWPLAFTATALLAAGYWLRAKPDTPSVEEMSLMPPEGSTFAGGYTERRAFALSPDGRRLAFVSRDAVGVERLGIREIASFDARMLPGTEGARYPFWSPDGAHVGFYADDRLKRAPVEGGLPQIICESCGIRGATWNASGDILVAPSFGPIQRVDAAGGTAEPVTALDVSLGETAHRWPHFLPDGEHFLFFVRAGTKERLGVYLGSLKGRATTFLVRASSNAIYAEPGFLLFVRDGALVAQPFAAERLELTGDAQTLPIEVELTRYSLAAMSVVGPLLIYSGGAELQQLTWFDRQGQKLSELGPPGNHHSFSLSPDEAWLALSRLDPGTGGADLWLIERDGRVPVQRTDDLTANLNPRWSSDGKLLFSQFTGQGFQRLEALASGAPEPAFDATVTGNIRDVSRSAPHLVAESGGRLIVRDWESGRVISEVPASLSNADVAANVSPDGRWLAFDSGDTGSPEIYVTEFPVAKRRYAISRAGGRRPRWNPNGRELFFIAPNGSLMTVPIDADDEFRAGVPRRLFDVAGDDIRFQVANDGERFLVNVPLEEPPELEVVFEWTRYLPR